jgi:hypothetical protein
MFLKKILMVSLFSSAVCISSSQASFTFDIEGTTPSTFSPSITVHSLASNDAIQALDGVPDLFTPLGLSGTINYGYENSNFTMNIPINTTHSMHSIFTSLVNPYMPNVGYPTPTAGAHPIVASAPNFTADFILAKSFIGDMSQWVLSINSNQPGQVLFFDVSQLSGFGSTVVFNNGMMAPISNAPQISKVITADIFPSSSGKKEQDLTAKFTIEGLSYVYQSPTNSFTIAEGGLIFRFKSAISS